MVEGGVHAAADAVLLVVLALAEGEDEGRAVLAEAGHEDGEGAHALLAELLLLGRDHLLQVRRRRVLGRRRVALGEHDVQHVDGSALERVLGRRVAAEDAVEGVGEGGARREHRRHAVAGGVGRALGREVARLKVPLGDGHVVRLARLEVLDVVGHVDAAQVGLHGLLRELVVGEERGQQVGGEVGLRRHLRGAQLVQVLLDVREGLGRGLGLLHGEELARLEGHVRVGPLVHARHGLEHALQRRRQLAERLDLEDRGEGGEGADEGERRRVAVAQVHVRHHRRQHVLHAVLVALDELVDGRVHGLADELLLHGGVLREQRRPDTEGVGALAVGELLGRVDDGGHGGALGLARLALGQAREVAVHHLNHLGGHRLRGLLVRLVQVVRQVAPQGHLQRRGALVAEVGHGVEHGLGQQRPVREGAQQLLHQGLHVLVVARHHQLQVLLRGPRGVQGVGVRVRGPGGRLGQVELVREGHDALHLGGVLELEGAEEVALLDDGARGLARRHLARLARLEGHDHLHRLNLHVGLAALHLAALRHEVAHHLARDVRAQLRGVVGLGQQHGHAVEDHAQAQGLLVCEHLVGDAAVHDEKGAVRHLAHLGLRRLAVDGEAQRVRRHAAHVEEVLGVLVRRLHLEGRHLREGSRGELALGEVGEEGLLRLADAAEGAHRRGAHDHVGRVHLDAEGATRNEAVQPRRVDGVLLELFGLQELHEVLDGGADLAVDEELLEGEHQGLARLLARGARGEEVAELRVGELVHAAVGRHRKVAPDVAGRLEVDALNLAGGGLEALVGVLRGDAGGDHVAVDGAGLGRVEVECLAEIVGVRLVVGSNLRHHVERDAHGHLELSRRQRDAREALGDGVLHLEPRVELEEVVLVGLGVVEVLDGACRPVANLLAQADSGVHHLLEGLGLGDGGRALLEDLLVAPLGGAVAAVERDGVAVLVADNLDLEVARLGTELHEEDGRAGHLVHHLGVGGAERVLRERLADALAAATLRGLEHHGVADPVRRVHRLLLRLDARRVEEVLVDLVVLVKARLDVVAVPGHGGHVRGLGEERRADLVAEHAHHRGGWAHESDLPPELLGQLRKHVGELGVLRCVAPAHHHGVHLLRHGGVRDELHVGVVVGVAPARHLHKVVRAANELGVGREVVGRGEDNELDDALVAKLVVGPLADAHNGLQRGHAVVRNKNFANHPLAATVGDILGQFLHGLALSVQGDGEVRRRGEDPSAAAVDRGRVEARRERGGARNPARVGMGYLGRGREGRGLGARIEARSGRHQGPRACQQAQEACDAHP
mmetsp:Transcript_18949/g.55655  ORF Transcript_18949/g.55655 Transcript_18949/m.55655 type:complete len:1292 (+) Transcript_18949:3267-7142(+)